VPLLPLRLHFNKIVILRLQIAIALHTRQLQILCLVHTFLLLVVYRCSSFSVEVEQQFPATSAARPSRRPAAAAAGIPKRRRGKPHRLQQQQVGGPVSPVLGGGGRWREYISNISNHTAADVYTDTLY